MDPGGQCISRGLRTVGASPAETLAVYVLAAGGIPPASGGAVSEICCQHGKKRTGAEVTGLVLQEKVCVISERISRGLFCFIRKFQSIQGRAIGFVSKKNPCISYIVQCINRISNLRLFDVI